MQVQFDSIAIAIRIYEESKFWSALVGGLWVSFKCFTWVKDIREKDLKTIQTGVTCLTDNLQKQTNVIETGFSTQTSSLVREVQELRSDFRTFYTAPDPLMIPVQARGPRKKASTAARAKAKSRPRPKAK